MVGRRATVCHCGVAGSYEALFGQAGVEAK
jgi:hypothetical protein